MFIPKLCKKIWFIIVVVIFLCGFGCRNSEIKINALSTSEGQSSNTVASPTPEKQLPEIKWIPSGYFGIKIGKSTRDNVVKKFGTPSWEGEEQIEAEPEDIQEHIEKHGGRRIMLEYKNVGGFEGRVTVFYSEKSKIVNEILLYPEQPISKEWLTSKYGKNFIELYNDERICSALEHKLRFEKKRIRESPQFLVFPEIGMYASVDGGESADLIGFSLICND